MRTKFCRLRLLIAGLSMALLACNAISAAGASRTSQSNSPSTTVVIDAGHGGHDRGGIPGQRIPEKEMTLDVAQRLKSLLAAGGYRVVMTRDSDVFVPLPGRVAIANSYGNAIFVCIHFNSAKRLGAGGIETYFYGRDSLPLASAIHYYVAGGRRRPIGFLTNPTEGQYVQTAAYRQKLAEEIAAGVRGRNSVASALSTTRVATSESIPMQSYIDQTKVTKSERRRSKHSHKKSARKKKSSRKPTGSEASAASGNPEGN